MRKIQSNQLLMKIMIASIARLSSDLRETQQIIRKLA